MNFNSENSIIDFGLISALNESQLKIPSLKIVGIFRPKKALIREQMFDSIIARKYKIKTLSKYRFNCRQLFERSITLIRSFRSTKSADFVWLTINLQKNHPP